jgi:hypothetical protein
MILVASVSASANSLSVEASAANLQRGATLEGLSRRGNWVRVTDGRRTGWMHNSLLRGIESAPAQGAFRASFQAASGVPCESCRAGNPVNPLGTAVVEAAREAAHRIVDVYMNLEFAAFKNQYEASTQSQCLDHHMGRVARLGIGRDLCYRAVKIGLQLAQRTGEDAYLEGSSASMAVSVLASDEATSGRPHVNLLEKYRGQVTSRNAPFGSILVYKGPWVDLTGPDDPKASGLRHCPTGKIRNRWPNDCVFSEYGRWYVYRDYKIDEDGKKRKCEGLGTQHGHIEVRTRRGYAHFSEGVAPIDEYMPGCRMLIGVMADPKVLDRNLDERCRR